MNGKNEPKYSQAEMQGNIVNFETEESTLVYIDNDILLKLCACDLFWSAINTLKFAKNNLRVLDSAQYVFRKVKDDSKRSGKHKKSIAETYDSIDPMIRKKAIDVVECLETVKANSSNPFIDLNNCPGLDQGEAILIEAAMTRRSFYFMSGDKKCFHSLGRHKELAVARERLSGRVICLEQVIRLLIEVEGFERVRDKVVPVRECDQALKVIFGSGMLSEMENSLVALSNYLDKLKRDCPGLLAPIGLI